MNEIAPAALIEAKADPAAEELPGGHPLFAAAPRSV
jgi:hypothetical protein